MKIFDYVLEKYKRINTKVKAGLWFTISNILLQGISFITLPIFTRLLTLEEYGTLTLFYSWVAILSLVISLNVWTGGFNVGLTKNDMKQDAFAASAQGLGTSICVAFLIISIVGLDNISNWFGLSPILTLFVFIHVLFSIPINVWAQKNRFNLSYKKVVFVSVVQAVVNPVLGYILVIDSTDRDFARILGSLTVTVILGTTCFLLNIRSGKRFFDKDTWSYLFWFNIVLLPHYISAQILNQSDRVMIANMCSNSEAGLYGVAYNFGMIMTLITSGIETVVTPHTFKCLKQRTISEINKMVRFALSVIVVGAILLMCIIPDVFYFILPSGYHEAVFIVPIVVASAFFQFVYPLFSNVELFYNERKYISFVSCLIAAINIGSNYILINRFGYVAAAYTTLMGYILFCILHYVFMNKVLKFNNEEQIYDTRVVCIISIALLVVTFVIMSLYYNSYVRYGVIMSVVFLFVVFRKTFIEQALKYFSK